MNLDQLIMGSMLGDGCIAKLGKGQKNHNMVIAHSLKQECYALYKYDILSYYNLTNSVSYITTKNSRYKNGETKEIRFKTKSTEVFNKYREEFYPKGKKIIPDRITDLNEEGLAIWFMDDGFRTGRNLKGAMFSTEGFTQESTEKLMDLLRKKWNLRVSRHKCGGIYVFVESVPKLLELITPFIPSCMMYKVLNKSGELLESAGEPISSQATDASVEGSQTTGGIGSLNNQLERPTPTGVGDDIVGV